VRPLSSNSKLEKLVDLLQERNKIDSEIAEILNRPALPGHLGEYIASKLFDVKLQESASQKGIDGVFQSGQLSGKTVNIKYYGKREGLLDISLSNLADYYLVLTGPKSQAISSRGTIRPFVIHNIYLFEMNRLVNELRKRGVKIGIATSLQAQAWETSEIYPNHRNTALAISEEGRTILNHFN
jgi:hypothetical protein